MKTIIWDFNGTIIDDMDICLQIENEMLTERGLFHHVSPEEYMELFCFPVKEYYKKIGYTFEKESYDTISKQFAARYKELFPKCKLTKGFEAKIMESKEKGYRNVILSVSEKDMLLQQCDLLGITKDFDEILGTDSIHAISKLEIGKQWMQSSDIDPFECLCIGDTTHDAEMAKALGTKCVLITSGHMSKKRLEEVGFPVVESLEDVVL